MLRDSVAADVPTDGPVLPVAATTAETDEPKSVVEPDRAASAEHAAARTSKSKPFWNRPRRAGAAARTTKSKPFWNRALAEPRRRELAQLEAILEPPAPAEPRVARTTKSKCDIWVRPGGSCAENFPVEAIVGDGAEGDEFDRIWSLCCLPEDVRLHFQATYGAGEPGGRSRPGAGVTGGVGRRPGRHPGSNRWPILGRAFVASARERTLRFRGRRSSSRAGRRNCAASSTGAVLINGDRPGPSQTAACFQRARGRARPPGAGG